MVILAVDDEKIILDDLEYTLKSKKKQPQCRVIILTAFEQYAFDAWKLYLDGYLLKPVTQSQLISALEHIGVNSQPAKKNLKAVCFGEFKLYYQDQQINFTRSKSEELFAILVNACGRYIGITEICDILWGDSVEEKNKKTYCRQLVHNIRKTLSSYSMEDVLIHKRSYYAIDPQKIDCDYFEYLKNNPDDAAYIGEYMSQYSWAKASAYLNHVDG